MTIGMHDVRNLMVQLKRLEDLVRSCGIVRQNDAAFSQAPREPQGPELAAPRFPHSRINVIRGILEGTETPATEAELRRHIAWLILMLDTAYELLEADGERQLPKNGWMRCFDAEWYDIPQGES